MDATVFDELTLKDLAPIHRVVRLSTTWNPFSRLWGDTRPTRAKVREPRRQVENPGRYITTAR